MKPITELGVTLDEDGRGELEGFYFLDEPHMNRVRLGLKKTFDRWASSTDFIIHGRLVPQAKTEAEFRAVLRRAATECDPGWGAGRDLAELCRSSVKAHRRFLHHTELLARDVEAILRLP